MGGLTPGMEDRLPPELIGPLRDGAITEEEAVALWSNAQFAPDGSELPPELAPVIERILFWGVTGWPTIQ